MESSDSGTGPDWRFIHFGLIVTGKTEQKCLPDLFPDHGSNRSMLLQSDQKNRSTRQSAIPRGP